MAYFIFVSLLFTYAQGQCLGAAFEGGGARGSYEAGVLSVITDPSKNVGVKYNVMTGISIGALTLNSIGGFPIGQEQEMSQFLNEMWFNITDNSDIFNEWRGGLIDGLLFQRGLYNNAKGTEYFHKYSTIPKRNVTVGAANLDFGTFQNFDDSLSSAFFDACVSSGSMPFFFPPHDFVGYTWMDGGTILNLDIPSAVERCLTVTDESQITIDVLFDSQPNILSNATSFKTIKVIERMNEIRKYDNSIWYLYNSMKAYPKVFFRHLFTPSQTLNTVLNFTKAAIHANYEIGIQDANNVISDPSHSPRSIVQTHYSKFKQIKMDFQSFLSSSKQQNHQIEEIIQILKSEIEVFQVQLSKLHKNSSKSTNSSSTRKISKEIIENFKSHWDFKVELEDIESKLHNFNSLDSKLDSKFPTDQIQNLNERKKEILEKLYLNMKEKQRLQKLVMEINDGSRREMIQLQIQIRNLKLEKLKLVEKNSCFRIEAENAKRENSQKDQIINQMKEQIEDMKGRLMRQKSAPNIGGLLMSPVKVNSNHSPTISKPSHRASSSLQQARFQSKLRGKQTYFGKTIQNFLKLYTCQTKPQIQQSSLSPTHPSKSPQKLSSICTRPKSRAIQNKLPSSSPSPVRHPSKQKLSNPLILKLHSNPNPSILRPRDHNIQYLQLKKFE